jgi:hypothetical protein
MGLGPFILLRTALHGVGVGAPVIVLIVVAIYFLVMTLYASPRILKVRKIDDTRISLSGVDPSAAMFIAHPSIK